MESELLDLHPQSLASGIDLYPASWSWASIFLLTTFSLASLFLIIKHRGCHMMDISAFSFITLYLIRFTFNTVFQVKTSHELIHITKAYRNRVDMFVYVMEGISPILLNLAYFYYVYEMVHVRVLLEAPNQREAAIGKRKANIARVMTMLSKFVFLFGVIGVSLSGEFKSTNAGIAL